MKNDFKQTLLLLIQKEGGTVEKFARAADVPLRTVQTWLAGDGRPPAHNHLEKLVGKYGELTIKYTPETEPLP